MKFEPAVDQERFAPAELGRRSPLTPSGTLCGLHEVERRLHAKTSVPSTWTERRILLGGSHTVFASGRECDGFPMARRGKPPVTHVKGGKSILHTLKFRKSSWINPLMGSATSDSSFLVVPTNPFQRSLEPSPLLLIDSRV